MAVNVSLTPELEAYAKSQVDAGLYGSVSEFMRSAVRAHRTRNIEYAAYLKSMRRELNQAADEIDSGDITPFNMQEIIDEVNAEKDE